MKHILVRREEPRDYRRTEEVARDAFWNLYFPGAHEHYIVHKMRQHPDFMPELSFVLEVDGVIQGGIFFTRSKIVTQDGEYPTVSFGPVFIAPELHRQGMGRILITHAIQKAKEMGHLMILILGYPYHYEPYGFCGGKCYGISMEDGKYYVSLLALPLQEGKWSGAPGCAVFSPALDVTSQEEVDAFDATFPSKKKEVLPCQQEFETACGMLDIS